MIGDSTVAKNEVASGRFVLEQFKPYQLEIYGGSGEDELHGLTPVGGGWTTNGL